MAGRCWWPFKVDPECKECQEWEAIYQKAAVDTEQRIRAERAARRRTIARTVSASVPPVSG